MTTSLQAGKPVFGSDFVGRKKETELLNTLLLGGQSVVLIAPRRYGKTSLMNHTLAALQTNGNFIVTVDLFSTPSVRSLAEKITREVLANKKLDAAFGKLKENIKTLFHNIELKQTVEEFEFLLNFTEPKIDEFKLLEESIDFLENFALKHNKKLIVGLDEFGDIDKLGGDNILKLFRSKIQLQKNVSYIFSGSYESVMSKLFVTPKSPFYRFARIVPIEMIDKHAFEPYIKDKCKSNDVTLETEALNKLLDITQGHPYYTQLFIQQLLLFSKPASNIHCNDIDDLLENVLLTENSYFEKMWETISSRRENMGVVLALANQETSLYSSLDWKKINISRSLKKLEEQGIIKRKGKSTIFTDPLLLIWIKKNIS
jgi:uncharacterized protein